MERDTQMVVCSNMLNEIEFLNGWNYGLSDWYESFSEMADGGMVIVDGGSSDGTLQYFADRGATFVPGIEMVSGFETLGVTDKIGLNPKLVVVVDNIIQREGYGPARNHLRDMAKKYFPGCGWFAFFDADERISGDDRHTFRVLKDYIIDDFDVIAFPRIDWKKDGKPAKDWRVNPDWQGRLSRLDSPIVYIRRLHEQITGHRAIYARTTNPKINHYHRLAPQSKRDQIGKVCAFLHSIDELASTYPKHHKEDYYMQLIAKEGM